MPRKVFGFIRLHFLVAICIHNFYATGTVNKLLTICSYYLYTRVCVGVGVGNKFNTIDVSVENCEGREGKYLL